MATLIILTLLLVVAFIITLAYFLVHISGQLKGISATLGKITFGVRAVETQCAVIGPATDRINAHLSETAAGLASATSRAERLAGIR